MLLSVLTRMFEGNMDKVFVCLANSRKTSGRCIAGKETVGGKIGAWVRPISEREHHEISEVDRRYDDGTTAQVFDIIGVKFKGKAAHPSQEENYTIDDGFYWGNNGRFSGDLDDLLDTPNSLWQNGYFSYSGLNDRVSELLIVSPGQSLFFISPDNFEIVVRVEGAEFGNGKKKVRARFHYNGVQHFISVTDPAVETIYLAQGEGVYKPKGRIYMTVSLGEPWDGYYYKLAAGIFEVK